MPLIGILQCCVFLSFYRIFFSFILKLILNSEKCTFWSGIILFWKWMCASPNTSFDHLTIFSNIGENHNLLFFPSWLVYQYLLNFMCLDILNVFMLRMYCLPAVCQFLRHWVLYISKYVILLWNLKSSKERQVRK